MPMAVCAWICVLTVSSFFLQAEDGIRDLVRSRGLGDVYKRQSLAWPPWGIAVWQARASRPVLPGGFCSSRIGEERHLKACLLYTSDAADERSSVDLGGRRIIKKKTTDAVPIRRLIKYSH